MWIITDRNSVALAQAWVTPRPFHEWVKYVPDVKSSAVSHLHENLCLSLTNREAGSAQSHQARGPRLAARAFLKIPEGAAVRGALFLPRSAGYTMPCAHKHL